MKPPHTTRLASVVLLVTWLNPGQPPASSQATFTSMPACETARDQIFKDAERIKGEYAQADREAAAQPGVIVGPHRLPPSVSAVCAVQ